MKKISFNLEKNQPLLVFYIIVSLFLVGVSKAEFTKYFAKKDSFYLFTGIITLVIVGALIYSIVYYYKYKSILLNIEIKNTLFSIERIDSKGTVIKKEEFELTKLHRAWILKKKRRGFTVGRLLVFVFNENGNIDEETEVNLSPSKLFYLKENNFQEIIVFLKENNPGVILGYL